MTPTSSTVSPPTAIYYTEITGVDWSGFYPKGGHNATGSDLAKAPTGFDEVGRLKTTTRGWFTPAQIQAVKTTKLKNPAGHVWTAFDPTTGEVLTHQKLGDHVNRVTRSYYGLKRDADHIKATKAVWMSENKEDYKKTHKAWRDSPAGKTSYERRLEKRKEERALAKLYKNKGQGKGQSAS
ncbi:unnamed protein product [Jaminaea pallidilutea]